MNTRRPSLRKSPLAQGPPFFRIIVLNSIMGNWLDKVQNKIMYTLELLISKYVEQFFENVYTIHTKTINMNYGYNLII